VWRLQHSWRQVKTTRNSGVASQATRRIFDLNNLSKDFSPQVVQAIVVLNVQQRALINQLLGKAHLLIWRRNL